MMQFFNLSLPSLSIFQQLDEGGGGGEHVYQHAYVERDPKTMPCPFPMHACIPNAWIMTHRLLAILNTAEHFLSQVEGLCTSGKLEALLKGSEGPAREVSAHSECEELLAKEAHKRREEDEAR
jgi:hypothetical protein